MVTASPSRAIDGSGNYSIAKGVDVASAPGDLGVPMFGVRVPASPSPATTSAGRYSTVAVDEEGKIVPAGFGAPAQQVQSRTDLTTTADVALVASAGAGLRTYVTDLFIENTGAASARVLLRDGVTTIASFTIPAGNTLVVNLHSPIRGSVATAVNAQLGAAGTVTVTLVGYKGI